MKEKTFSEMSAEAEEYGDVQYWIAFHKPSNTREVIQSTGTGEFNNFNEIEYRLAWEEWTYFGPIFLGVE